MNVQKDRPKTAKELGIMEGFPPLPAQQPTLANWDLPPWNRWSFQNVRSLVPSVDVFRGWGPPSKLEESPADLDDLTFKRESGETVRLERFLDETYTDGFLVMHRNQIVYERYLNGMKPQSLHLSQSAAKSVVGLLAGILNGEGLIDLKAPLTDLIPELAVCGYAGATLDQALDMRTGVHYSEDYNAPHSDMTRIDIASGWRPSGAFPRETIRGVILSLGAERAHGGDFHYRSIETDVVAWALERAARMPLAELVSDRLWQKIGVDRDAYFTVDQEGTAQADGGFNATLRDYARIGRLVLNEGVHEGVQVLPRAWVNQMRNGDPSIYGPPYDAVAVKGAYRRFWWICDADRGDIAARGVCGQLIYVDPESDLVVTKLSSWPDYLIPAFTRDTYAAIDAIRRSLFGDT